MEANRSGRRRQSGKYGVGGSKGENIGHEEVSEGDREIWQFLKLRWGSSVFIFSGEK